MEKSSRINLKTFTEKTSSIELVFIVVMIIGAASLQLDIFKSNSIFPNDTVKRAKKQSA